MSARQILVIGLVGAISLDLWEHGAETMSVSIIANAVDQAERTLLFHSFKRSDARVTDQVDGIWFGDSLVKLPLVDLLRVADAMLLEIPPSPLPAAVESVPSLRSSTVAGIPA